MAPIEEREDGQPPLARLAEEGGKKILSLLMFLFLQDSLSSFSPTPKVSNASSSFSVTTHATSSEPILARVLPSFTHSPVVVFEAGPPVWRLEQSLEGAGEVDEAVAHQEEHG